MYPGGAANSRPTWIFLAIHFELQAVFCVLIFSHTFLDTSSWCVGVPRCAFSVQRAKI